MRVWAALAVAVLAWGAVGASAQVPPAVGVAPFWDLSADGAQVDAQGMNRDLARLLDRTGRFRVVPAERVSAAMRALGYFPSQLFHPATARQVSEAAGLDWLVVGRWTHLDLVAHGESDAHPPRMGGGGAVAVLELWVWDRARPRPRLEAAFDTFRPAASGNLALKEAAEEVLRKAAAAVARL